MSKKVVIVAKSLSGGGAERAAAMQSVMLCDLGYQVHTVVLYNEISFNYAGTLHILQENTNSKIKSFQKFRRIVKQHKFDAIIDFRGKTNTFRELLINRFIYKNIAQKLFTLHSSLPEEYLPSPFFLFKNTYKNRSTLVTVSKSINHVLANKYNLTNVITIANAIDLKTIKAQKTQPISITEDYILFVGRLDNSIKQVDKLIEVYSQSSVIKKGIKLLIIGNGKDKKTLQQQVIGNKLQNMILFLPFQEAIYAYMSKAKFLILNSKREGFPFALLESLACETPVISFNCFTGPNEIIKHEYNGLLVENQNFEALKNAMNVLIENEDLYKHLKSNALKSVLKFDYQLIKNKWKELID